MHHNNTEGGHNLLLRIVLVYNLHPHMQSRCNNYKTYTERNTRKVHKHLVAVGT